jgi:hypothetical protein
VLIFILHNWFGIVKNDNNSPTASNIIDLDRNVSKNISGQFRAEKKKNSFF